MGSRLSGAAQPKNMVPSVPLSMSPVKSSPTILTDSKKLATQVPPALSAQNTLHIVPES